MGEEMIGREVTWQQEGCQPVTGYVRACQPRDLVDVETGAARPAVRFQIETAGGGLVWTDAMAT